MSVGRRPPAYARPHSVTPEPYLMGLDPRRAEEVNSPSLLCPTIAHTMFSAIGMG